ncbi:MAG TPA: gas vesicle protein GvpJ [Patescibacteria group bacterium]|nr:gas vesicle protein GvpJ [Patescibacteria group bacterium]
MRVERSAATANIIDVLDRVLDKGIVIDAWVRVSLVGIELVTVEARLVVASIGTYLGYADILADLEPIGATTAQEPSPDGHHPSR